MLYHLHTNLYGDHSETSKYDVLRFLNGVLIFCNEAIWAVGVTCVVKYRVSIGVYFGLRPIINICRNL